MLFNKVLWYYKALNNNGNKRLLLDVEKNAAYGRHQLSRPMRIEEPIQFWKGCVIRSAPKSGLCTRENADSVHAKVGTRSTQKC